MFLVIYSQGHVLISELQQLETEKNQISLNQNMDTNYIDHLQNGILFNL